MAVASSPEQKNNREMNQVPRSSLGQAAWWQPAIIMFLKLSVWIAAPVIAALYLGEWLDLRFKTKPWLFLICLALAFAISMFGLIRSTLAEYKKIEREGKAPKDKK